MSQSRTELLTISVPAGGRTFFFDVKESQDGAKYMVISEARANATGFEHDRVMIFEEYLDDFYAGFDEAYQFMTSKQGKAYNVEEIRQTHPRAYEPWLPDEEEALLAKFESGLSIDQLADLFERKPGAIRSRLKKLGLIKTPEAAKPREDVQNYPRTDQPWSASEDKALRLKIAQGMNEEEIAGDLLRHPAAVKSRLTELESTE